MIPPTFRRLARGLQASALAVTATIHMDGFEIAITPSGRTLTAVPAEDRQFAQTVGVKEVITSAPVRTLHGDDLPRLPRQCDRITDADGTHVVAHAVKAPLGKWDCLLGKA